MPPTLNRIGAHCPPGTEVTTYEYQPHVTVVLMCPRSAGACAVRALLARLLRARFPSSLLRRGIREQRHVYALALRGPRPSARMGVCGALGRFSHVFALLCKILMRIRVDKCSPPTGQFLTGRLEEEVQALHMRIIATLVPTATSHPRSTPAFALRHTAYLCLCSCVYPGPHDSSTLTLRSTILCSESPCFENVILTSSALLLAVLWVAFIFGSCGNAGEVSFMSAFRAPPRKGENFELAADLNSEYREKRKDAIKKVIANMTVQKDVSGLFPDVLKNMQTDDLEQKKLVYLYLMNYAKTQPELVILAVNTFVKDTDDPNPLVRVLAIRTMGCLRAEKIIDYLCDPLQKCLKDDNPYVRKTAALCVAKLYDLKPELVIEDGFLEQLQEMIADSNPMVVANTVAALTDIHIAAVAAGSTRDVFVIMSSILNKLLIALNECSAWGRVAILNALARYESQDDRESEHICERVVPQFQHANASVRPELLSSEMRVFFCKYNDPLYVKVEKLDIMVRLAGESNIDALLSELKEYASEVDVDFVRKQASSSVGSGLSARLHVVYADED
ncbi:Beta-adaptin-like protein C [Grifola frondosa]|uniref:Beta-adaptin-like protein C n=1 Tax=Grifola frondosa TaxID=5627 RepID=A0A1C7LTT1_GRIFR|nr:Beta-adaptin-like protein C [Grifola frondosa]